MVIWIIGLSGSGKSFLADKLKKKIKNSIIVDGDQVRKYLTSDLGYNKIDRKKNSLMIQKLCRFLEEQKFNVICPILSIFPEHQKKNRKIFKKYIQIYLKSSVKELRYRSKKIVYNLKKNVVGKDIKFPSPHKSHFIFKNKYDNSYKLIINQILNSVDGKN